MIRISLFKFLEIMSMKSKENKKEGKKIAQVKEKERRESRNINLKK